jgi:NADPH:quinone reductase-like Zn-dependent oxidoreductase
VIAGVAGERAEDVQHLLDLARRGHLRPVLDGVLPFEQIAAAHARVDSGRKRGSLVLTLG